MMNRKEGEEIGGGMGGWKVVEEERGGGRRAPVRSYLSGWAWFGSGLCRCVVILQSRFSVTVPTKKGLFNL